MTTIKYLINQTEYASVQKSIEHYYSPEKNICFHELYELLRGLTPHENKEGMTLYIWVYEKGLSNNIKRVQKYNESACVIMPDKLLFDVYGLKDSYDNDLVYSICRSGYKDFLGYYVDQTALECFSKQTLLAHFLWELCSEDFEKSRAL